MYKNIYLVMPFAYFYQNRALEVHEDYKGFEDRLYPDRTYPFFLLKQALAKHGISLKTYDYFDENDKNPYALLFIDVPKNLDFYLKKHPKADKFLHDYESPLWKGDLTKLDCFKKIFTWDSRLTDNKTIFTVRYSNRVPQNLNFDEQKKEKLCLMISTHKLKPREGELYSERVKAIDWFEAHAPKDFDLYGMGWDKYYFKGSLVKLNHFKFLTKLLKPSHPSYKGPAEEKLNLCKKYAFYLCYENTIFPEYISEKIFDNFWSGVIPVYLGAPNITNYIPENTFIDKRKFDSYETLYAYLKNMPESEYQNYLSNVKKFALSEQMYPFTGECFAKTLSEEILKSGQGSN